MNILRIVYDWPEPWSGLAPGPYFLSRSQGLLGNKITVLTGGLDKKALLKLNFIEKPEENVTVIKLPRALTPHMGPFITTSPAALMLYLIFRFFADIDVVHGHAHTTLWFDIYKLIFGILDRTIYVKHFHICSKERKLNAIKNGEKFTFLQKYFENPLHELSDVLSLRVCNKAIVVSESLKDELIKYYPKFAKKIKVVENGVPTHIFKPDSSIIKEKNKINLLSVGVLSNRKGAHLLLESLKQLPGNYNLTWIGNFENSEYKKTINNMLKDPKLKDRVKFIEYISNLKIAEYFNKSDLFVLPSQSEGFPKVVLEALACGLECLVSGFKASDKIKGIRYFSNLSPDTIAQEIQNTLKTKNPVDTALIQREYSWDAKAIELDKIYSRML